MRDTPPLHTELDGLVIDDVRDAERYEARLAAGAAADEPSVAAYHRQGDDVLVFTHTEVPRALEGHGVASRLVRAALDDVRARGLRAAPMCPYVFTWLQRHPAYHDVVEPGYRERLVRRPHSTEP
jgi:predicted GNAT family acetyltransferase